MSDYGIFGHGSSGSGWFSRKLNDFHDSTKKYDPLGHYSVENPMKTAHWLVEKSSKGLADAGIGEGFNTRLNQEANENGNDFGLGTQRMGVGIASVLAAMYGYGALGEGAGGSAGTAEGGGSGALGYGTEGMNGYTMPGSGGESAGAWFDVNGLPGGSSFASDIPTQGGGNGGISNLMRGVGNGNQGQQKADNRALQQQQEMARLMREAEQRRRAEEAQDLPGWVNDGAIQYG
jgi:hypothetical protein